MSECVALGRVCWTCWIVCLLHFYTLRLHFDSLTQNVPITSVEPAAVCGLDPRRCCAAALLAVH